MLDHTIPTLVFAVKCNVTKLITGNENLSEIFYRYIFGINLRSLRDFVIELTRSQDFHKKWPVTLTLRSRSPESKLVRDHL